MASRDAEGAVALATRVLVMASSPGRIRREIVVPLAGGHAAVVHGDAALDDAVLSAIALRSPVPSP